MAVLLHYFFLSAFAWMLVEGLHLYSMVIKVFGSEDSKHRYYYGMGWGRWGRAGGMAGQEGQEEIGGSGDRRGRWGWGEVEMGFDRMG